MYEPILTMNIDMDVENQMDISAVTCFKSVFSALISKSAILFAGKFE